MTSRRKHDQERRMVKNFREKVKRRKERIIKSFHEFGLLSGAKMYLLIQDGNGDMTEYRNTSDRKFPPTYTQLRRLFPSAQLLTPESFGATASQAEIRVLSNTSGISSASRQSDSDLDLSKVGLLQDCELFPVSFEPNELPELPSELNAARVPTMPDHPGYGGSSNRFPFGADGMTSVTEGDDYGGTIPLM